MGIENLGINYLAVLAAGIAHFLLGGIWYSAILFGNTWMKAIGKTKEQAQAEFSPWNLVGAFVGSMLIAYGLARILSWTSLESIWGGITVGLLTSVCFVVATSGVKDLMESRPSKLFLINASYNIVGFVITGVILGVWR